MSHFASALFLYAALFVLHAVEGVQIGLQPSSASHAFVANLAVQTGPFDWMKRLFSRTPHEVEVHGPVSKVAKVEIYYETLCPYCTDLFNESVRQIFEDKELMKRVDMHLYPFGNALITAKENISEGFQFWHEDAIYPVFRCQHGDQECLGNMIQACVIDQVETAERYVPMTICMASYGTQYGIEKTSFECGEQLGLDMHAIKECANSRSGSELLSAFGEASDLPELNRTHVPFVVINGVHEGAADDGQLLKPLCTVLEDPKPSLCDTILTKEHGRFDCGGEKGHGC